MYKLLPVLLLIASTSITAYSQTSKVRENQSVPTNIQRYGNDYELVDFTLNTHNQSILETLDLASVEHLRLDTEDIIVSLPNSDYQILLYAKDRVRKPYFFNTTTKEPENETN